jgi:hypothetical protein
MSPDQNPEPPKASAGMRRATGRDRSDWFDVLDAWGAPGRPYREIADWLMGEHSLTNWWAQKLIVEYEEARGLRDPGVRRDGTFEVGASKTVGVPVERLVEAFTDGALRDRWLPGASMREHTPRSGRTLTFDWDAGGSRVVVTLDSSGETKSQVAIQHVRLSNAKAAADTKTFWRERLTALKGLLES